MKKLNLLLFFVLCVFLYSCDDDNNPNTNTFKDKRDGQVYKTVKIGDQTWMAENLKFLPSVVGSNAKSKTTPYYYVYEYEGTNTSSAKATNNFITYGVLYNWPAVMAGSSSSETNPSNIQGICPKGWHLPSNSEFNQLLDYLGGRVIAGGKLKEIGTTHWEEPNTGATNEVGFSALPSGFIFCEGDSFIGKNQCAFWWSTSDLTDDFAISMDVLSYNQYAHVGTFCKESGVSVRCIKD